MVTSSLPPFWHTKKGGVVIALVVLSVVGAIVGGAVGGAKAHADSVRQDASLTSSTSRTGAQAAASHASNSNMSSVSDTTFCGTTGPSGIVSTTPNISTAIQPVSSTVSLSAVVTAQSSETSQHQAAAPPSVSPT